MKRILIVIVGILVATSLSACDLSEDVFKSNDQSVKNWSLIEESAEGTDLTMAIDHSNPTALEWFKNDFVNHLSREYNIRLTVVEEDRAIIQEILDEEKASGITAGRYDLIMIEGEGYEKLLDGQLLYGPFLENMPNVASNVDLKTWEFQFMNGIEPSGYLSPIGRSQLSMIYNQDVFYEAPLDYEDLVDFVEEYKNAFVYPDPRTSIEGELFVVGLAVRNANLEKLMTAENDEEVSDLIGDGLELLNTLEPYMYEKGTYYPKDVSELDQLFIEDEVIFSMSMNYDYATEMVRNYEYPEGAASFVFESGTTGMVEWIGISDTAPNKSGAMLAVNELLSPEIQASRYDVRNGGYLPVYSPSYTPSTALEPLKSFRLRSTSVKFDEMLESRIGEIPVDVRKMIIGLWERQVLNEPVEE